MANLFSIARPYALAAFECAREKQQLPAWKIFLEAAASCANEPAINKLMTRPDLEANKLFELFHELLATYLDTEKNNFLLLLAQNKRFSALPEISNAFNSLYAELEKVSTIRVVTATETNESFRQKLTQALTKRIQREVTLECEVDSSLIAGAIIHIGDRVIDGSIRGKLSRLLLSLTG